MIDISSIELTDEFDRALRSMHSGSNVFITGKAGTGKSTLLRLFLQEKLGKSEKSSVVVAAPTGVAALNVGGTTIHRLFGFPATVSVGLVKSTGYKRRPVLSELETLVIDEVSMVRADLMDAMNAALERYGPVEGALFGGVQLILIGDPYQLPPVVHDREMQYLESQYGSPYFFSSESFRKLDYEIIDLDRVFRQRDAEFVRILNAVREGEIGQEDLDRLNSRYDPDFVPDNEHLWVTLTTTNAMAQKANETQLDLLNGNEHVSRAEISGEISPSDFPTEEFLRFKVGAQVMLLTNDDNDRWVNGSMGVITGWNESDYDPLVEIRLLQSNDVVCLGRHAWEVTQPVVREGRIRHEVIGTFWQLPFKLAWAITIHKSQGQTLDRAIISLGRGTFANGQLYVALSRCTSLEGLVLKSVVKKHHVKYEREVSRFLRRAKSIEVGASAVGTAALAIRKTGFTRFDRIVELAAVIQRPGKDLVEVSSLIAPMRDMGDSSLHNLTAGQVSIAPTLAEAWPYFSRQMDGCVIVGQGLAAIQTSIEEELERQGIKTDLGLGIDVKPGSELGYRVDDSNSSVDSTEALSVARDIASRFAYWADDLNEYSPYIAGTELRLFGRIASRQRITFYSDHSDANSNLTYSDAAVNCLSQDWSEQEARAVLEAFATECGLSSTEASEIHEVILKSIVEAVNRDMQLSDYESAYLQRASIILNVSLPTIDRPERVDLKQILIPQSELCFTGASSKLVDVPIERSELERLARERGLKPVKSVTRKCVALIAADTASMSGKAKIARNAGVPIFSVTDFLAWLDQPKTGSTRP